MGLLLYVKMDKNVIQLTSAINPFTSIMPDLPQNFDPSDDVIEAEVVNAEIVEDDNAATEVPAGFNVNEAVVDLSVQRLSAKGGAVGSVLLAILGLGGMAFSSYSVFNVLLAFAFSLWGLKSPLRRTAMAGFMLALAGGVAYFLTLLSHV